MAALPSDEDVSAHDVDDILAACLNDCCCSSGLPLSTLPLLVGLAEDDPVCCRGGFDNGNDDDDVIVVDDVMVMPEGGT